MIITIILRRYSTPEEYVKVESIVLITLVLICLCFENIHEWVHESLAGVRYGVRTIYRANELTADDEIEGEFAELEGDLEEVSASVSGGNMHFHALMTRINGEFMVLGFLAFFVWCLDQADAFTPLSTIFGMTSEELVELTEVSLYPTHSSS